MTAGNAVKCDRCGRQEFNPDGDPWHGNDQIPADWLGFGGRGGKIRHLCPGCTWLHERFVAGEKVVSKTEIDRHYRRGYHDGLLARWRDAQ